MKDWKTIKTECDAQVPVFNPRNPSDPYTGPDHRYVTITNVNIPFSNLITLMVQLAIAAVPAAIIVAIIWAVAGTFLIGI